MAAEVCVRHRTVRVASASCAPEDRGFDNIVSFRYSTAASQPAQRIASSRTDKEKHKKEDEEDAGEEVTEPS